LTFDTPPALPHRAPHIFYFVPLTIRFQEKLSGCAIECYLEGDRQDGFGGKGETGPHVPLICFLRESSIAEGSLEASRRRYGGLYQPFHWLTELVLMAGTIMSFSSATVWATCSIRSKRCRYWPTRDGSLVFIPKYLLDCEMTSVTM
jgi:hypothetical protein